MLLLKKQGMTMLEYSVLFTVIVCALLAMQVTVRRTISYRWKGAADNLGSGMQYEQGVTVEE